MDLGQLAEQVVQQQELAHPITPIVLTRDGALTGHFDADRMVQLLTNLLVNARLHGRPTQPVQLRLDGSDADQVGLSVTNEGAMSTEQQRHVFEPFHGSSAENRRTRNGLGLGLYIVQQIAQGHGGQARVDVPDGADLTVFTVTLPR